MKRLLQVKSGTSVRVIDFDGGMNPRSKLTQFSIYLGDCLRLLRVAPTAVRCWLNALNERTLWEEALFFKG